MPIEGFLDAALKHITDPDFDVSLVDDATADAVGAVVEQVDTLVEQLADHNWLNVDQSTDLRRDIALLRQHLPTLQRYTRFGFAIITAGIASGEHERAIYEYLQYKASFEERQEAILGIAADTVAAEIERQRLVQDAFAVLEKVSTLALQLLTYAAFEFAGIPFGPKLENLLEES